MIVDIYAFRIIIWCSVQKDFLNIFVKYPRHHLKSMEEGQGEQFEVFVATMAAVNRVWISSLGKEKHTAQVDTGKTSEMRVGAWLSRLQQAPCAFKFAFLCFEWL